MDTVIALLGGVALFLYGMMLMGNGLKAVAGSRLELILYRLCGTPFRGILLGTGVTAVIQSSSATSIMVVGFVNSGMMKVRQAIGWVRSSEPASPDGSSVCPTSAETAPGGYGCFPPQP